MAKIRLPKGSGKRLKVREKSVKSQGILKWILSGNPGLADLAFYLFSSTHLINSIKHEHSCKILYSIHRSR